MAILVKILPLLILSFSSSILEFRFMVCHHSTDVYLIFDIALRVGVVFFYRTTETQRTRRNTSLSLGTSALPLRAFALNFTPLTLR